MNKRPITKSLRWSWRDLIRGCSWIRHNPLTIWLVAFTIAVGWGYVHLQQLREQRIKDTAKDVFESCRRNNFQDVRDKSQDQTLLDLLNVVLSPGDVDVDTSKEFIQAKVDLEVRVSGKPPFDGPADTGTHNVKDGKGYDEEPVNCYRLLTQREFGQ